MFMFVVERAGPNSLNDTREITNIANSQTVTSLCGNSAEFIREGAGEFVINTHGLLYPPQTLFVGGILFSRCPSVHPSVRASVRNALFP